MITMGTFMLMAGIMLMLCMLIVDPNLFFALSVMGFLGAIIIGCFMQSLVAGLLALIVALLLLYC